MSFLSRVIPAVVTVLLTVGLSGFSREATAEEKNLPLFVFDEAHWVLFYDLPSHRLREVREELADRDLEAVIRDLKAIEGYTRIEAQRSMLSLPEKLVAVADSLAAFANEPEALTLAGLKATSARLHWLLSQHYLLMAIQSRSNRSHHNAGHYIAATAHHLERAIVWSDMPIEIHALQTLNELEALGNELLEAPNPDRVYGQKPLRQAWKLIQHTSQYLKRQLAIEPVEFGD